MGENLIYAKSKIATFFAEVIKSLYILVHRLRVLRKVFANDREGCVEVGWFWKLNEEGIMEKSPMKGHVFLTIV